MKNKPDAEKAWGFFMPWPSSPGGDSTAKALNISRVREHQGFSMNNGGFLVFSFPYPVCVKKPNLDTPEVSFGGSRP